jgi:hypothetical protein
MCKRKSEKMGRWRGRSMRIKNGNGKTKYVISVYKCVRYLLYVTLVKASTVPLFIRVKESGTMENTDAWNCSINTSLPI